MDPHRTQTPPVLVGGAPELGEAHHYRHVVKLPIPPMDVDQSRGFRSNTKGKTWVKKIRRVLIAKYPGIAAGRAELQLMWGTGQRCRG